MKSLLVFVVMLAAGLAQASNREFVESLECKGTAFRPGSFQEGLGDSAALFLDVVKKDGKIYLEEFGGNVYSNGYYGIFHGKDLAEKPFQRASKYKNHYRFQDFDAAFTAGAESGMWGYLVVNKDIHNMRDGGVKEVDAHYIFQAGDHMGGTVDFVCSRSW
ncbi:MAG: hypothetical protein H6624_07650 [Bdellovibrionaceae bacterium]|nr:hypothetical protein [Bdellovibrionales bacterium]MCB9084204.1 hypothetical protein [Pseudobdellovibrionaceae bacterium]